MASRFHLFGAVLARFFFPQFSIMDSKTVQRSAFYRSRRELSNDYLLVKFGFDTTENKSINLQMSMNFRRGAGQNPDPKSAPTKLPAP